jgi:hypothetical protein
LLKQLVPLLEYAGEQERLWLIKLLKLLVNRFGSTQKKGVVKLLLQSVASACAALAYESTAYTLADGKHGKHGKVTGYSHGRHRGLNELLELALDLIKRWRAPLLAYQRQFIVRSLGALHTLPAEHLTVCHEALKDCQFAAIEKDIAAAATTTTATATTSSSSSSPGPASGPQQQQAGQGEIAVSLVRDCLLRRWPRQSVEKQELFLEELEGLLAYVPPIELFNLGHRLGCTLDACLRSPHSDLVLGSLYLLTAEDVETTFSDAAAEVADLPGGGGAGGAGGGQQVDSLFRKLQLSVNVVVTAVPPHSDEILDMANDVSAMIERLRRECVA